MRYVLLVVSCLLFLIGCKNKDEFTISGQIENTGNVKVISLYEGDRKLDSIFFGDNNAFQFKRPTSQARLLSLRVGKNRYDLIASPGEEITFKADLQKDVNNYQIEGSNLSSTIQSFSKMRNRRDFVRDSLQAEFGKKTLAADADEIEILRSEYKQKFTEQLKYYTKAAVDFANQHDDIAGFYAISTLDPEIAESEIIRYADQIKDKFLDNGYVTQFKEETNKLKRLAVGQPAPDFESFTPNNKSVKLSDFRGKYVLLDFWASWCTPCRQENPNVVRLYHTYKAKGFDVFGVSLDDNPGPWMRAITDDQLQWTNASDLKAWGSSVVGLYRITGIPTSYIVDPKGLIVAKNLRGQELEEFLKKTLK
ncbi:AhpC/TSA family protein [Sphingobacterium sp. SRCM116780]|uniref:TlpA disulfide reductase family protein n=1 Tax=Sphingobacterium sp. SRCM116780 TaxID=2907623 RepID=UPI001F1EEF3E|nr:TlpA disulfide reductase family protein [Sphingobacterium sp. SRCM116780]UIR56570.1 AhpC/TSA family protein [Sphingobacterium sp. SRCM116780]